MKRNSDSWMRHLDFLVMDAVCLQIAFAVAYYVKFSVIGPDMGFPANPYASQAWRGIAIVLGLLDLLVLIFGSFLEDILDRGYIRELLSLGGQMLITEILTAFYMYLTHSGEGYSRAVIISTGLLHIAVVFILRTLWKRFLNGKIRSNVKRTALLGGGEMARRFVAAAAELPQEDITVYLSDDPDPEIPGYKGGLDRLAEFLATNEIDEVVAALESSQADKIAGIVSECEKYGVRISMIPYFSDVMSSRATIREMGDVKLLNFRSLPLDNLTNAMVKRLFDIFGSLFLIILTSPVMLFVAIGTRLSSPGPVLFRQERIGRNKKSFTMLKFRSMRVTGTENTGWTTDDDPRKTRFGSFIRKFSLDELPQFFNVLAGQMSLIGPRPELPYFVEQFADEIPMYQVRHQVRPGITGWAQVNGFRGDTSIPERVKYDVWYIENWSFALDIKILFRTVFGGMINSEKMS